MRSSLHQLLPPSPRQADPWPPRTRTQSVLSSLHDASLDQIVAYVRSCPSDSQSLYAALGGRAPIRSGLIIGAPSRPLTSLLALSLELTHPADRAQAPVPAHRPSSTRPSPASSPRPHRAHRPPSTRTPLTSPRRPTSRARASCRASRAATAPTSRTRSGASSAGSSGATSRWRRTTRTTRRRSGYVALPPRSPALADRRNARLALTPCRLAGLGAFDPQERHDRPRGPAEPPGVVRAPLRQERCVRRSQTLLIFSLLSVS